MRTVSEKYLEYINSSLVRRPKSMVIIDGITYSGEARLISYPKVEHKSEKAAGSFPAATCEFEIYNPDGTLSLNGKEVTVCRGLEINGKVEWIQIGIFTAKDEDIKTNINKRTISFKGTDFTSKFEFPYGGASQWQTPNKKIYQIVQEICNRIGVPLYSTDFPLADYSFIDTPTGLDFANITDRQMISYIAELCGCIAVITPQGKLCIKVETETNSQISKTKYKSLSVKNAFGPINTISFGYADYDDALVKMQDGVTEETKIEWAINDNPLTTTTDKINLINLVSENYFGRLFLPFELNDFVDDFLYELNDSVIIEKKDGSTIKATILETTTQSRIKSNFKASLQTPGKSNTKLAGSVKESVKKVRFIVDHLNSQIISIITDNEKFLTMLTQTQETLKSQAVKIEAIETAGYVTMSQMQSSIEQSAESIKLSVTATLDEFENTIAGELKLFVKQDDNDQIVSMLNASANVININSDRLIINSTNFKLAQDGTVSATNANIINGVVDISDKYIGVLIKNGAIMQSGFQLSSIDLSLTQSGGIVPGFNMNAKIDKSNYGGIAQVADIYTEESEDGTQEIHLDWYEAMFFDKKENSKGAIIACRNNLDEDKIFSVDSYTMLAYFTEKQTIFNSDTININGSLETLRTIKTNITGANPAPAIEHFKIGNFHGEMLKKLSASFGCGNIKRENITYPTAYLQIMPDNYVDWKENFARLDIFESSGEAMICLRGIRGSEVSNLLEIGESLWFDGNFVSRGIILSSVEEIKENIESTSSVLDIFSNSSIYKYNYIDNKPQAEENGGISLSSYTVIDVENSDVQPETQKSYGFVIGEGYNTPREVLSDDGKHINLYSMASLNWKATQELLARLTALETKIENLQQRG